MPQAINTLPPETREKLESGVAAIVTAFQQAVQWISHNRDTFKDLVTEALQTAEGNLIMATYRGLQENDISPAELDAALRSDLGLQGGLTCDLREAYWEVLHARGTRRVPRRTLPRYVRRAVPRQAARIRRDREQADRIWFRSAAAPAEAPDFLGDKAVVRKLRRDARVRRVYRGVKHDYDAREALREHLVEFPLRDPIGDAILPAAPEPLRQALSELLACDLRADQLRYLTLRRAGHTAAEAVRLVGKGWSPHIALRAKLLRLLKSRLAA